METLYSLEALIGEPGYEAIDGSHAKMGLTYSEL